MDKVKAERADYYVYCWHGPGGGMYIGKGRGGRAYVHFKPSITKSLSCPRFYNAILKYGKDSFRLEFLKERLTDAEAMRDEILCIYLKEPKWNLTAGGDGMSGHRHSEEAKARMSAAFTPEMRAERSRAFKGVKLPAERGRRISKALTGRKRPAEVMEKVAKTKRLPKDVPETALRLHREGKSLAEALKVAGCSQSGYRNYLKRHGIEPVTSARTRPKVEKALSLMGEGLSQYAAAKAAGCAHDTITNHLKRRRTP